jgi:peptidase M28-like protein/PDZ domain-containing protein/PA domain-containing protein
MKNKLFRRNSLLAILSIAISVAALAQQPASKIAPSVDRLRRDVTYLASDALEGRRTGTAGANDAAHYIAAEFSQIGLQPAFQTIRAPKNRGEARSNYRQKFPYVAGVNLGNSNEMSFKQGSVGTANALRVSDDWTPLGFSANGRVENTQAVFVGFGITAGELKYDDYSGAHASGKIAIAFSGTPDGDNPHGQFARYEDARWKAIAARNAGAKALIVIAREENFKDDLLAQLRHDNSAGDAGLPVVAISRSAAVNILGLEGSSALNNLQKASSSISLKKLAPPPGWSPEKESWLLPNAAPITLVTDITRREVSAANVIGILEGSDPSLKNEAIVIGAHYDHLGRGGAGSLAQRIGEVHHGADDNASGTAGVIELARIFSTQRPKPRRTIVFVAFSGEEEGLLGSNYYVNHPVVSLANTVAMINMDMIGRMKDRKLVIGGVGTAPEWPAMIERAKVYQGLTVDAGSTAHSSNSMPMVVGANGRTVVSSDTTRQFLLTLNEDGFGPSDHSSFYAKQVPVLFFWTGTHVDYHKPSDTAEKINYDDEARIIAMVARIVRDIDASDKRPTYQVAKSAATGRSTGFRVYLGTIPNYADSSDGLLLDGVRDDSPAAQAGLKAGDRIVKLAGRDVHNVYDYTAALGEMKAGQEYEVEIVRGSERLKLKLTPAVRK